MFMVVKRQSIWAIEFLSTAIIADGDGNRNALQSDCRFKIYQVTIYVLWLVDSRKFHAGKRGGLHSAPGEAWSSRKAREVATERAK